jgi:tRNA 2-thiouridine synthesizing protein E
MTTFHYQGKIYEVDSEGFLLNHLQWDRDFAEAVAARLQISGGLTPEHWVVVMNIRETYLKTGKCPLVFQAFNNSKLRISKLRQLFPAGYWRGACKIAGLTYAAAFHEASTVEEKLGARKREKFYLVDRHGFLVEPSQWDEDFAACKAQEMKLAFALSEQHWRVIRYLRDYFQQHLVLPTIFETCKANGLDLDDMEQLFPDGYHRGAFKIAGFRIR